jgi:hypothetical protein
MKTPIFITILFTIWLGLSLLLGKFDAPNDGLTEIGFPFIFFREFSGKCVDCSHQTGFLIKGFMGDLAIISALTLMWHWFRKNTQG